MSSGVLFAGVAVGAVVLLLALVLVSRMRADARGATGQLSKEARQADAAADGQRDEVLVAASPAPSPDQSVVPDEDSLQQTRRQFLNRSIVAFMAFGIGSFSVAAMVQFLWPLPQKGFGGKIVAGNKDTILSDIANTRNPFYSAEGRFYIVPYPVADVPKAEAIYSPAVIPGMQEGVLALYQKCPHLGCRVPFCASSQWFECPCHGSQFNRVGEKKGGPAPAGMFQFPTTVSGDGTVTVDTGTVIIGVPIGTNSTGQEAEGPHCV